MSFETQQEQVGRAIEAITQQIEVLSSKCALESNRKDKNYKFEHLIEATSLMLQLSRTLNELIVTQSILKNSTGTHQVDAMLNSILGGRKS